MAISIRRISTVIAVFAVLTLPVLTPSTAYANTSNYRILSPIRIFRDIGVGNSRLLAEKRVDEIHQGTTCDVTAVSENWGASHPGNDLVIASGNTSITLDDVENINSEQTNAEGQLTLGDTITVSLVMGEDDIFSAGIDMEAVCEDTVNVCRDGERITILESQRRATDTDTCEDASTSQDDDRDDTTVITPVSTQTTNRDAEVLSSTAPIAAADDTNRLPNTGASTTALAAVIGFGILAGGIYTLEKRRLANEV